MRKPLQKKNDSLPSKSIGLFDFLVALIDDLKNINVRFKSLKKSDVGLFEINRIQKEIDKLSIVANQTDNGIMICDHSGKIEWINAGMTRLLGYNLDEVIGIGPTLQDVSGNADITAIVSKCLSTRHSVIYETLNKTKSGEVVWVQSTLTPVIENNCIKSLVLIDTDITERKKFESELQEKNKNFTDSVNYAKRIQTAVLPTSENILQSLPESFVFYRPKDIVSGDFYGFTKKNGKIIFAVGDCTGHGVPGAFMSMIGINILNHLTMGKGITNPAEILNGLHNRIRRALKQDISVENAKDGMDMGIIAIDLAKGVLEFAGAMRPLYIIRKDVVHSAQEGLNNSPENLVEEIKGNKHSIGGAIIADREHVFTNHVIKINKGDTVYMFSDGYVDQFGGEKEKKFLTSRFKEMLCNINHLSMPEQEIVISNTMIQWQGNIEQVDDILIVGIRI